MSAVRIGSYCPPCTQLAITQVGSTAGGEKSAVGTQVGSTTGVDAEGVELSHVEGGWEQLLMQRMSAARQAAKNRYEEWKATAFGSENLGQGAPNRFYTEGTEPPLTVGTEPPLKKARADQADGTDKKVSFRIDLSEGLTKLEWAHGEDSVTLFMEPRTQGKRLKPNTVLSYISVKDGVSWVYAGQDGVATCMMGMDFLCWCCRQKESVPIFCVGSNI